MVIEHFYVFSNVIWVSLKSLHPIVTTSFTATFYPNITKDFNTLLSNCDKFICSKISLSLMSLSAVLRGSQHLADSTVPAWKVLLVNLRIPYLVSTAFTVVNSVSWLLRSLSMFPWQIEPRRKQEVQQNISIFSTTRFTLLMFRPLSPLVVL